MFQRKVVNKIEKHILCAVTFFFFFENRFVFKTTWKNILEAERPQMAI
jgi:hypothetical protein